MKRVLSAALGALAIAACVGQTPEPYAPPAIVPIEHPRLGAAAPVVRYVVVDEGQSNAYGDATSSQLAPVVGSARFPANGWIGAPRASLDTGYAWPLPTAVEGTLNTVNTKGIALPAGTPWSPYLLAGRSSYGPEASLFGAIRRARPGLAMALVETAVGGSAAGEWDPAATPPKYWPVAANDIAQAKARLAAAGEVPSWSIVWSQGESGAGSVYAALHGDPTYEQQTHRILDGLRGLTDPSAPILMARIGQYPDSLLAQYTSATVSIAQVRFAFDYRRHQQESICASTPGCTLISQDGLPFRANNLDLPATTCASTPNCTVVAAKDAWHFVDGGYQAIGEREAAAWLAAVPPSVVVVPPPPTDAGVDAAPDTAPPLIDTGIADSGAPPTDTAPVDTGATDVGVDAGCMCSCPCGG